MTNLCAMFYANNYTMFVKNLFSTNIVIPECIVNPFKMADTAGDILIKYVIYIFCISYVCLSSTLKLTIDSLKIKPWLL